MAVNEKKEGSPQWPYKVSHERSQSFAEGLSLLKGFVTSKELGNIEGVLDELNEEHENCSENLQRAIDDVVKDSAIVITGTVSAGKSSLINKIVKKNILQKNHRHSTDKICRIQNSSTFKLVITEKSGEIHEWLFDSLDELAKHSSICSTRKSKSQDNSKRTETFLEIERSAENSEIIDIFLPLNFLKGDVFLVDTPGYEAHNATNHSGNDERIKSMNDIVRRYLPNAVTCICVLNAALPDSVNESMHHLIEEIHTNLDGTHCFDPKDVIFLINKFDTIDDNELWDTIKTDILRIWPYIASEQSDETNIFKFSLREVERQSEYQLEYERFEKTLDCIVEKYQNKRMCVHSTYAKCVIETLRRSLLSRLKISKKKDEDNIAKLQNLTDVCDKLPVECQQKRKGLEELVKTRVGELHESLKQHINSKDFKKKVLEFEDATSLTTLDNIEISNTIRFRFQSEIQNWMSTEGENVRKVIDGHIERAYKELDEKIKNVESYMTGRQKVILAGALIGNIALGVLTFTTTPFAMFIASVAFLTSLALWRHVFRDKNEVIEETFLHLLNSYNENGFKNLSDMIAQYQRKIDELFAVRLPAKIKSMQRTIESLKRQEILTLKHFFAMQILERNLQEIESKMTEAGMMDN